MARPAQSVGDVGQRQIVRGDQSQGAMIDESLHDAGGADPAVVRVGAAQQFIQQEQHRTRAAGEGDDFAQARDLGIEAGTAVLQRILHANGDAQAERRNLEARGAHRSAGPGQHGVDPDGAQQGALAGHVGAADDPEPGFAAQLHVVADGVRVRHQRMRQGFGFEPAAGDIGQLGKNIGGMFVAVARQRAERFEFARGIDPFANVAARDAAPSLDRHGHLRGPQQARRRWARRPCSPSNRDGPPAGPDGRFRADAAGSAPSLQSCMQLLEQRRAESFHSPGAGEASPARPGRATANPPRESRARLECPAQRMRRPFPAKRRRGRAYG